MPDIAQNITQAFNFVIEMKFINHVCYASREGQNGIDEGLFTYEPNQCWYKYRSRKKTEHNLSDNWTY